MRHQKHEQRNRMLVAAAAVAAGLLGGAITGCDDNIDSNPGLPTTKEETEETEETDPEDSSGLQQTNSFGYIPEHERTFETDPIGPEGGNIENDPFELGGGSSLPGGSRLPAEATLTTPTG